MASSMGGMFTGQQPSGSHPPTGPGQPGLLTGPPGNRGTNNTLVDDLEASFEVRSRKLLLQSYHTSECFCAINVILRVAYCR